jgi:hypothetical protein
LVSDSNQPPTLKNGGDKLKQYCLNYQLVKKLLARHAVAKMSQGMSISPVT